jgi:hypothetical protein
MRTGTHGGATRVPTGLFGRASRVRYRVGQVLEWLRARRTPPEAEEALALLPRTLAELFHGMPPEDRRHGLTMLSAVRDTVHVEGASGADPDGALLQAALLHDVGKAKAGVGLVHRIARVALQGALPGVWAWLCNSPTGWKRPFWAVANHPARGAVWIDTAGGSPDLVALVRYHESDPPDDWPPRLTRWHAMLSAADAEH